LIIQVKAAKFATYLKNHFTHLQQRDEKTVTVAVRLSCLSYKNRTSQRKKAGVTVTTHAQHGIISICI